ncbi:hypothetical protein KAR91_59545 [Candidatus Pacearchaeota archaeon]|nr:hypothetical protein [Candidatus Pacearchaeota archaeon]
MNKQTMTDEQLKAPDCPHGCMKRMRDAENQGKYLNIICECEWMVCNPYQKGLKIE